MDKASTIRYFNWLCAEVKAPADYSKLLWKLFNTDYIWDPEIESDQNREFDGISMRMQFTKGLSLPGYDYEFRCTLLEMMIALSYRIERDIMGEPGDDIPHRWFWEMIQNLQLGRMDNHHYDDGFVDSTIGTWLRRGFAPNGVGSPFPIRHATVDQRLVPIWDQVAGYLNERY